MTNPPSETGRRIVEIAVGYLTVVTLLVYPIGLVSLALQLWNAYSFSLSDAFFVVALAPITLATSKLYDFITWGVIAIGIVRIQMTRRGTFALLTLAL